MMVLAVVFLVLAVMGGIASHVLSHAARQIAQDGPDSLSFSALIGWAAFCQAVFIVGLMAGFCFILAHAEGWR